MKKTFLILSITVISVITYAQIPTNGLIAWYPLTGNAVDSSGNGYDGIITTDTGNYPKLVTGHDGIPYSAYEFKGGNTAAIALPAIAVQGDSSFSIFCWIKVNWDGTYNGTAPIMSIGGAVVNPANQQSHLIFYDFPQQGGQFGLANTWDMSIYGQIGADYWVWHYIGVTYDHDTRILRLYKDSAFVSTQFDVYNINTEGQSNFIGHNDYVQGWFDHRSFNGTIDNLVYFGRVIDSAEIIGMRDNPQLTITTSVSSFAQTPPSIDVYPNPSSGSFTVTTSAKAGTFQLYNMLGDIIRQGTISDKGIIQDIPQGIYLLKVTAGGIVQEKKVVVCR